MWKRTMPISRRWRRAKRSKKRMSGCSRTPLRDAAPVLAGIDVHAIPPKGVEPLHLHHDLIWSFRAASETIAVTGEAPSVQWATEADWERLGVAENIRRSILRTRPRGARA